VIETENQRRWWFATHPEYSRSRRGARPSRNESLTYEQGRKEGTKGALDPNAGKMPPFVLNPDYMAGFFDGIEEAKTEYRKGWESGYWAIHNGKVPPDLSAGDNSPYAQGVREGAAAALDELAEWHSKWVEDFPLLYGAHSRTLGKNLEKQGEIRPSGNHDAHHIVAWNHWRAGPARRVLEKLGISIDDAVNGVWLHRSYHRTLNNSKAYHDTVNRMLTEATSKKEAFEALERIKQLLSSGKFPR